VLQYFYKLDYYMVIYPDYCINTFLYIHVFLFTHTHTRTHAHTHTRKHAHTHTRTHAHTRTHEHTHEHTHKHTHTHYTYYTEFPSISRSNLHYLGIKIDMHTLYLNILVVQHEMTYM